MQNVVLLTVAVIYSFIVAKPQCFKNKSTILEDSPVTSLLTADNPGLFGIETIGGWICAPSSVIVEQGE